MFAVPLIISLTCACCSAEGAPGDIHDRLTTITYPGGERAAGFVYGAAGGIDDKLSRISRINFAHRQEQAFEITLSPIT